MKQVKFLLDEDRIPSHWYNILADLPEPMEPPLNPQTGQPVGPQDLSALFPMDLIEQEVSSERDIEIPEEVLQYYRQWRPSTLYRAHNLEKALDTPAHIYYKYEGSSPVGSHKLNTAIAQAYYNREAGIKHLSTETGAGQWGTALSLAGVAMGIDVQVFMVRISYDQKPYRRAMIETYGGKVIASPSDQTQSGRDILAAHPDSPGSLGIAISEAVEVARLRDDTNYALGSVLNHVLLHQTVIGKEALLQMEMAGEYPDVVIGCSGGGSNFAGLSFPFVGENLRNARKTRIIAVEPASCPTLTKGKYAYDYGDVAGLTPMMKMYTLGHGFVPESIHAGGLRYHGMSPIVSHLFHLGQIEAQAFAQNTCFEAGTQFAQTEGIVPAPESTHAIRSAINEALRCKEAGTGETILFNLSGHGHLDMQAYMDYNAGLLEDHEYDVGEVEHALMELPSV
ncbi:MAG: TrpB-like pyridoxal phosphate-dependent enzyme [Gammaproteobacteria bacterium]|nr:TrpB-like pyridoxal phosphate-dependent enzyme [Gammaproteobacteria bacterium]